VYMVLSSVGNRAGRIAYFDEKVKGGMVIF